MLRRAATQVVRQCGAPSVRTRSSTAVSASNHKTIKKTNNINYLLSKFYTTSTSSAHQSEITPQTGQNVYLDEAKGHIKTVRDCIRFATSALRESGVAFGQGSTSASEDAIWLVLGTLNLPLHSSDIELFLDARVTPNELNKVMTVLHTRITQRIPTGYLTKRAIFGNYEFYVDQRTIIPRSLIAEVLTNDDELPAILPEPLSPQTVTRCLDLCTGSGALAIILADIFPKSKVDAVDISTDALEVAKKNVSSFELTDRVSLIHSDMFSSLSRQDKYDIIVCNPPYVTQKSMDALPQEFLKEPQLALFGGNDGLKFVELLLNEAADFLKEDGVLIIEGGKQRDNLTRKHPNFNLQWLDTSVGNQDVFLVKREDLAQSKKPATQKAPRGPAVVEPRPKSGNHKRFRRE